MTDFGEPWWSGGFCLLRSKSCQSVHGPKSPGRVPAKAAGTQSALIRPLGNVLLNLRRGRASPSRTSPVLQGSRQAITENVQRLQKPLDLPLMGRCTVSVMPWLTEINPARLEGARVGTVGVERRV